MLLSGWKCLQARNCATKDTPACVGAGAFYGEDAYTNDFLYSHHSHGHYGCLTLWRFGVGQLWC